jgi:hypothetical protein
MKTEQITEQDKREHERQQRARAVRAASALSVAARRDDLRKKIAYVVKAASNPNITEDARTLLLTQRTGLANELRRLGDDVPSDLEYIEQQMTECKDPKDFQRLIAKREALK